MLTELRIANFALIEQVHLEFSSGFHVLTGETGAGKSILVDAIALLIGGRATMDQIRADVEEATLEAAFTLSTVNPLAADLREEGLLRADETDIIVRRILSRSGRHRIYLNGNLISLHTLQRLSGTLVDIHGQHDQQSLLSQKVQRDALDAFGRLLDLRRIFVEHYECWREQERELEEAERVMAERRAQEDLIRYQYDELSAADLRTGEEESLHAEFQRLGHSRRLAELGREAYDALYGDDRSVLSGLAVVGNRLTALLDIDPQQREWVGWCDSAQAQLRELAHQLHIYQEQLEHDPNRLGQIEERLDRIQRLKKKYGSTIEGLLTTMHRLKRDLDALASATDRCADLRESALRERHAAVEAAAQLSAGRRRAAERMERRIQKELQALRMDHTRLEIQVRENEDASMGPAGRDRVEFVLASNPGEPFLPLAKVASGGELSRLMLAIKTVLAESDTVPVLIFDEIDTGIGGAVATAMGQRLRALARYHQVLCITHLPQIASQATSHFLVEKTIEKRRTSTRVIPLSGPARQDEIARMVGGLSITQAVRDTAAQMLREADPAP